jgi:hypothetical protein
MQRGFSRASVVALAMLVLSACSSCTDPPPPPRPGADQSCTPTKEPAPAVTGSGALIVTDTSGSMKGFVETSSTRLYSLHDALERALRNALGAVGSNMLLKRCDLGSELKCEGAHTKAEVDKPIYTASESRLDLFFTADAKGKPASDGGLIETHRVAVLATDGMQAQPDTSAGGGQKPCLAGADPECMAYLLKQRIAAGYGVWLTLVYLPFKGVHGGYRPLDKSHWQRIQQHVAGLAQDPYFQGVKFLVKPRDARMPFTSYEYQGVKPFLLMAVSKDHRAGREFVKQFDEIIRQEKVAQPANGVYWIELAPLPPQTLRIANIKQDASSTNTAIRLVKRERKDGFYDFLVECEREGETTFTVEAKRTDEGQRLLDSVSVEFNLAGSGDGKFPAEALTIKNPLLKGNDPSGYRAELTCKCKAVRAGSYERWFKLQANLKAALSASSPWAALHADNIYEAPERFYGLKEVIQKVLEPVTKEPRVSDCLHFRLQRK